MRYTSGMWGFGLFGISLFFLIVGCDNAPVYNYQSQTEALTKSAKGAEGSSTANAAAVPGEQAAAKVESAVPTYPKLTVSELLKNSKAHDNKKIVLTGKLGKIIELYEMSFLANPSGSQHVEFSYKNMSIEDKAAISGSKVNEKGISVIGLWDASKSLFVGESLAK